MLTPPTTTALPPSPLPLDYLVILDLEAYCDNPSDPQGPELVEFPFLVYDLHSQTVVDHKQIYITPTWSSNPNPPPDLMQAAFNIDVAFAPSLSDAIAQFDTYVYQSFFTARKTFYLLTDGPWDLTRYLYFEAARKSIMLHSYFRTFFDIRTEFSKCYSINTYPNDRRSMFEYLNIPLPSRGGSGIDECIGISALVTRLLRDGHRFLQPEIIGENEWNCLNLRIPAIATPVAAAQPVGAVIRLRGLPWASCETDVETFLQGIPIVPRGIHFVRNLYGKVTGEAFVQLETSEAVSAALARHKRSVGRRYIEVFKSSPVDMANHLGRADAKRHLYAGAASVAAAHRNNNHHQRNSSSPASSTSSRSRVVGNSGGGLRNNNANNVGLKDGGSGSGTGSRWVVKVTGLPGDASVDDVALLMEGVQITGDGVQLVIVVDGVCTGDAYVEVASEAHVKKALARAGTSLPITRPGDGDATRYVIVDVRKSNLSLMRSNVYGAGIGNIGDGTGPGYVMGDVTMGMGGIGSIGSMGLMGIDGTGSGTGVSVNLNAGGRHTSPGSGNGIGSDIVVSSNNVISGNTSGNDVGGSGSELQQAIAYGRQRQKSNNSDQSQQQQQQQTIIEKGVLIGEKNKNKSNGSDGGGTGGKYMVSVKNVPKNANVSDILDLLQDLHVTESDVHLDNEGAQRQNQQRTAKVLIQTREERDSAVERSGRLLKGNQVTISKRCEPYHVYGHGHDKKRVEGDSKMVRMRGLPFSAGDEDIVQFFNGYRIVAGGIVRGRDRHGRASGEACVTFESEEEAWKAVQELDKEHMGNRYIELRF